jgi:hypothetical protein
MGGIRVARREKRRKGITQRRREPPRCTETPWAEGRGGCGCRRMWRRSGVPAIGIAGTQGLAPMDVEAPPEVVSEQIELAS